MQRRASGPRRGRTGPVPLSKPADEAGGGRHATAPPGGPGAVRGAEPVRYRVTARPPGPAAAARA
jgi:hypothetical protein